MQPFFVLVYNTCNYLSDIVVEQVTGHDHVLNHLSIPAACFTHPEISMVGLTEVYTFSYLLVFHPPTSDSGHYPLYIAFT